MDGKVAADSFGDLYIKQMKDSGVAFNEKQVDGMTGTCIVLISPDAQRTFLTCLGVSSEISYNDIDEESGIINFSTKFKNKIIAIGTL